MLGLFGLAHTGIIINNHNEQPPHAGVPFGRYAHNVESLLRKNPKDERVLRIRRRIPLFLALFREIEQQTGIALKTHLVAARPAFHLSTAGNISNTTVSLAGLWFENASPDALILKHLRAILLHELGHVYHHHALQRQLSVDLLPLTQITIGFWENRKFTILTNKETDFCLLRRSIPFYRKSLIQKNKDLLGANWNGSNGDAVTSRASNLKQRTNIAALQQITSKWRLRGFVTWLLGKQLLNHFHKYQAHKYALKHIDKAALTEARTFTKKHPTNPFNDHYLGLIVCKIIITIKEHAKPTGPSKQLGDMAIAGIKRMYHAEKHFLRNFSTYIWW